MTFLRAANVAVVVAVLGLVACSDDDPPVDDVPTHPEGVLMPKLNLSNRPFGAAAGASSLLLATRLDDGSMGRGLTTADTIPVAITVGDVPTDVTLSADGSVAYVTNQFDDNVGFVSLATGTQTSTTPMPGSTFRVRQGAGTTLWVSTNVSKVYAVNTTNHAIVDSVTVGGDPNGLALSPDGSRLYVTNRSSGDLSEVNIATMTVVRTIALGGAPQDVVVSPNGDELYIANEGGPMQVVTLATGAVTPAGDATSFMFGLALSPDGVLLIGSRPGNGDVLLITRTTRAVSSTIATGGLPRRVAFNPLGSIAIVANEAGWVDRIR